ncbi:hypothetical protein [Anaerosinus massiliensis]|uniref:hypothetical protein n=1 Tax=Massilibacillus massiliensis TaxID=1806837 RepID=UPI000DA63A05|nr:hypothetical protein [Massilibacillus massiliensis]
MKKTIVGRHINGIFLNDLEYLLDENGELMQFESEESAVNFLKEKGATDDEIYYMTFKEIETEEGTENATSSI